MSRFESCKCQTASALTLFDIGTMVNVISMKTAQELLNQIRWDERLTADNFVIGYYDRMEDTVIKVAFKEIRFPDDHHFMFEVIDEEGELHSIPYHRVKEIYQNDRLIWQRKN